jgi:hypothetical protein
MSKAVTTPPVTLAEMNSAFSNAVFPPPTPAQLGKEAREEAQREFRNFLDREGYVPNQN